MYYGWIIVAAVFLGQFFATGFYSYGFGLLVIPMQEEFAASRTEIMYGITGAMIAGLVWAPIAGMLVDKWSVRGLMSIGAAVFGVGLVLLSRSESIVEFSILFSIFISVAMMLLGPITGSAVVSRWFTSSRGKALGIAAIGTSVGGLVVPALMEYWLANGGWRHTLSSLGYTVLILLAPLLIFSLRNYPHEKGLQGEPSDEQEAAATAAEEGAQVLPGNMREWSTAEIIRSRPFWLIGLCLGLLFMSQTAVLANLPAYAIGLDVSKSNATRLVMVIAFMGMIGKLIFGYAADRVSLKLGLSVAIAFALGGLLIFITEPSFPGMLVGAVVLGLAAGGMLPVWGAMIAAIFGMLSYGRVMGVMMPLISILIIPGPLLAGYLHDQSGSYVSAFSVFSGILVLSMLTLVPLKIESSNS